MNKKTDTVNTMIAIIGCGRIHTTHHTSRIEKMPVLIIENMSEKPLDLELLFEKIPIFPFPPEIFDRQLKFSHHGAPRMRYDRSTVKNYDKKLRAKSKRFKNKKGRGR